MAEKSERIRIVPDFSTLALRKQHPGAAAYPIRRKRVLTVEVDFMEYEPQALELNGSDSPQWRQQNDWTHAEVREEMGQILGSSLFAKSARLSRFLRTTVEYLLEGKAEQLKEYTIGTVVYERHPSYDPTVDTIVRTEARRLRAKVNEFYSRDLSSRSVMINFVAGSYVPVIKPRKRTWADHNVPIGDLLRLRGANEDVRIAVSPFRARSTDHAAHLAACDLTDELMFRLSQRTGLSVFRSPSDRDSDSLSQLEIWDRSGVNAVIYGSIRIDGDRMNTTVHLTTIAGLIFWAQRFDLSPVRESLSDDLPDELVNAIVNRLEKSEKSLPLVV